MLGFKNFVAEVWICNVYGTIEGLISIIFFITTLGLISMGLLNVFVNSRKGFGKKFS